MMMIGTSINATVIRRTRSGRSIGIVMMKLGTGSGDATVIGEIDDRATTVPMAATEAMTTTINTTTGIRSS